MSAGPAEGVSQLLVGLAKFVLETPVARGFLERIKVLTVEVLDELNLQPVVSPLVTSTT